MPIICGARSWPSASFTIEDVEQRSLLQRLERGVSRGGEEVWVVWEAK